LAVEVACAGHWEATLKAVFFNVVGRDAEARQQARCRDFVREYDAMLASQVPDPEQRHHQVLAAMVQTLLMSNEFLHVR
jgi:hypothetical protein